MKREPMRILGRQRRPYPSTGIFMSILPSIIMMVIAIIIFMVMFRSMQGGGGGGKMMSFGKSNAKVTVDEIRKLRLRM